MYSAEDNTSRLNAHYVQVIPIGARCRERRQAGRGISPSAAPSAAPLAEPNTCWWPAAWPTARSCHGQTSSIWKLCVGLRVRILVAVMHLLLLPASKTPADKLSLRRDHFTSSSPKHFLIYSMSRVLGPFFKKEDLRN